MKARGTTEEAMVPVSINCAGEMEFEIVDGKRMTKIHDGDFRLITR